MKPAAFRYHAPKTIDRDVVRAVARRALDQAAA